MPTVDRYTWTELSATSFTSNAHPAELGNPFGYEFGSGLIAEGGQIGEQLLLEGLGDFFMVMVRSTERFGNDAVDQTVFQHIVGSEFQGFGGFFFMFPTAPENG